MKIIYLSDYQFNKLEKLLQKEKKKGFIKRYGINYLLKTLEKAVPIGPKNESTK
jgi:hypothetical protein